MKKKLYLPLAIGMILIMFGGFSVARYVHADDDDGYEDGYDDEDDDEDDGDVETPTETVTTPATQTAASAPKKTYTTQTIVTPAQTTMKTVMEDVIVYDTDRDGIFDDEDEYPSVPNQFIVEDANSNGIVDSFEIIGDSDPDQS